VDGIGEVVELQRSGESQIVTIKPPPSLSRYVARKGSITINGVSLTVNRASGEVFEVNLIPHTLAVTNLSDFRTGTRVNMEVDMLARYIEKLMAEPKES
jgi:riboflavin synthase